jgi:hypothetical protein
MNEDKAWVAKIIESCSKKWHFEACQTLIELFAQKYMDWTKTEWVAASQELQQALDLKISLAQ